jgi:hypothetical protein
VNESITRLSNVIEDEILARVRGSPFFGLMIDETTDVSVLKQLIFHVRSIQCGHPVTNFLGVKDISDGKAATILSAIDAIVQEKKLDPTKLVGFASDGASVMMGEHIGVASTLKSRHPALVVMHCLAHRLALAAADATAANSFLRQRFCPSLAQLSYFFDNSSVRCANFAKACEADGLKSKKLVKPSFTRWLSYSNVVVAVREHFIPIVHMLQSDSSSLASSVLSCITEKNFVHCLLLLSDTLPLFAQVCKIFQFKVNLMLNDYRNVKCVTTGSELS